MNKITIFLIKKLVGKNTVIMNAEIDALKGIMLKPGDLVVNNTIMNFNTAFRN